MNLINNKLYYNQIGLCINHPKSFMRFLLLFLLLFLTTISYSQSIDFFVINSMGESYVANSGGQLTCSVGEASVMRRLGISELITDGFLQYRPNPSIVTATTNSNEVMGVVGYPNPTTSIFNVSDDMVGSDYFLLDVRGTIVQSGKMNTKTIDLSELRSGVYTLTITNQSQSKSFKIVKQ
jgi:hypothetical protein